MLLVDYTSLNFFFKQIIVDLKINIYYRISSLLNSNYLQYSPNSLRCKTP